MLTPFSNQIFRRGVNLTNSSGPTRTKVHRIISYGRQYAKVRILLTVFASVALTSCIAVYGEVMGTGVARTKADARNEASKQVLQKLGVV